MPQIAKYILTAAVVLFFIVLGGIAVHVLSRPPEPGDKYIIGGIAFAIVINLMALKDFWPSNKEDD